MADAGVGSGAGDAATAPGRDVETRRPQAGIGDDPQVLTQRTGFVPLEQASAPRSAGVGQESVQVRAARAPCSRVPNSCAC